MTGGTLTSKTFPSLHRATMFAVYQVAYGNVHEIYKL